MNEVILKINPEKGMNTLSINGQPLSLYSELNNFLKEPFSTWVDSLFEMLEREINDDFTLTLMATDTEREKIELLSKECDSCVEFMFVPFSGDIKVALYNAPDKLELGKSISLDFRTENDGQIPVIRANVVNKSVISSDGMTLCAIGKGETDIEFYKNEELIPFEKIHISVYQDNFIKKIELSLDEKRLGAGMKIKLNVSVFPQDADDADDLIFNVSDDSIAEIDSDGYVLLKRAGNTTITVHGRQANAAIDICVLPDIQSIQTSVASWECYIGNYYAVDVFTSPKETYDNEYAWKSSNPAVATVKEQEDGTELLYAKGVGECTLTCYAKKGNASATIPVHVRSVLLESRKDNGNHTILILEAVAFALFFILSMAEMIEVASVFAIVTVITGIAAIIRNQRDFGKAVLIMLLPLGVLFGFIH